MATIQVSHIYTKVQEAFEKGYTTVSEQGSSRSAKTYSNVIWLCAYCLSHSNVGVSIVRATLPALKASVFRDFVDVMNRMGVWDKNCFNKSDMIYTFPNGSFIEFFSCTDEQRIRGRKRDILFVNEANELKFIEWQQLQMRTTLFTIIDYNPSFSDEHWINLVNQDPKTMFFISTYKDNPFLEQKVIDEIESLQWKNKSLWQVYGLGQRAIVEGLIFTNVEIVEEIPAKAVEKRFLGMDLGYATDPTAIVEVAIYRNCIYIDEHCYRTHMLTSDIIRELKELQSNRWQPKIISESADPRMIDEIYNAGLDIHPVHKYAGSIMAGLQKMQEYKICITRRSTNVLREFHNYTYRQDKEGKWLNEPIDAFNHCFTGDTKILTQHGNKLIKDIQPGDTILTSEGYQKVLKRWDNGKQSIYAYAISFDEKTIYIRATPEHLVKTREKWVKLKDLRRGMRLFIQDSGDRYVESEIRSIFAERVGIEEVYDLEVENCHEYFANGLLVHNCIDATRYVILEEVLGGYGNGLQAEDILDML